MAGLVLRVARVRDVVCESDGLIDHLVVLSTEDISPGEGRAG